MTSSAYTNLRDTSAFLGATVALLVLVGLIGQSCHSAPPPEPITEDLVWQMIASGVKSHAAAGHVEPQELIRLRQSIAEQHRHILALLGDLSKRQADLALAIAKLRTCLETPAECGLEVDLTCREGEACPDATPMHDLVPQPEDDR